MTPFQLTFRSAVPPASQASGIYQSTHYRVPEDVSVQNKETSGFMKNRKFINEPYDKQLLQKFHFEKLTVAQVVNKFPAFHGVGSSISSLTCIRQQTLSPVSYIRPLPSYLIDLRLILILSPSVSKF